MEHKPKLLEENIGENLGLGEDFLDIKQNTQFVKEKKGCTGLLHN